MLRPIRFNDHDALTAESRGEGEDASRYRESVAWAEGDQLVSVYSDDDDSSLALDVAKSMTMRSTSVPLLGNVVAGVKPMFGEPAVSKAGSQRCVMWTTGTAPACGPAGTSFVGTLEGPSAELFLPRVAGSPDVLRLIGGVPADSTSVEVTAPTGEILPASLRAAPGAPDLKVFEVSLPPLPKVVGLTSGLYTVTVRAPGRPDETFQGAALRFSDHGGFIALGSAARVVGAPFKLTDPGIPEVPVLSVQPLAAGVCLIMVTGVCTAPTLLQGQIVLLEALKSVSTDAVVGLVRSDAMSVTFRGKTPNYSNDHPGGPVTIAARLIADPLPIPGWKEVVIEIPEAMGSAELQSFDITVNGADGQELGRISSSTTGLSRLGDLPTSSQGSSLSHVYPTTRTSAGGG